MIYINDKRQRRYKSEMISQSQNEKRGKGKKKSLDGDGWTAKGFSQSPIQWRSNKARNGCHYTIDGFGILIKEGWGMRRVDTGTGQSSRESTHRD